MNVWVQSIFNNEEKSLIRADDIFKIKYDKGLEIKETKKCGDAVGMHFEMMNHCKSDIDLQANIGPTYPSHYSTLESAVQDSNLPKICPKFS